MNAAIPPIAAKTGRNSERPLNTTSVSRTASPAPWLTPRMYGLASSLRVTAWKIAPDTARFAPTKMPTKTRGRRRLQMTVVVLFRFASAGTLWPSRNAPSTSGWVRTFGLKTACHACGSVVEYAPKLTCTSAETTTIPILASTSAASDPSIRSPIVVSTSSVMYSSPYSIVPSVSLSGEATYRFTASFVFRSA